MRAHVSLSVAVLSALFSSAADAAPPAPAPVASSIPARIAPAPLPPAPCPMQRALLSTLDAPRAPQPPARDVLTPLVPMSEELPRTTPARPLLDGFDETPARGPRDAKVTAVVWLDFTENAEDTFRTAMQLSERYPGDVQVVFKQAPLTSARGREEAAVVMLAAHRQGRFFDLAQRALESKKPVTAEALRAMAAELGLDVAALQRDTGDPALRALVRRESAEAALAADDRPPHLFVDGVQFRPNDSRLQHFVGEEVSRANVLLSTGTSRANLPGAMLLDGRFRLRPFERDSERFQIEVGSSPTIGPDDAPVTVVAFLSATCPGCIAAWPALEGLRARYPDQLRIVVKQGYADGSVRASALVAARSQGRYEAMAHVLMGDPSLETPEQIDAVAVSLGLDLQRFHADQRFDPCAAHKDDLALAAGLAVAELPSLFVNGRRTPGNWNVERLAERVEEELKGEAPASSIPTAAPEAARVPEPTSPSPAGFPILVEPLSEVAASALVISCLSGLFSCRGGVSEWAERLPWTELDRRAIDAWREVTERGEPDRVCAAQAAGRRRPARTEEAREKVRQAIIDAADVASLRRGLSAVLNRFEVETCVEVLEELRPKLASRLPPSRGLMRTSVERLIGDPAQAGAVDFLRRTAGLFGNEGSPRIRVFPVPAYGTGPRLVVGRTFLSAVMNDGSASGALTPWIVPAIHAWVSSAMSRWQPAFLSDPSIGRVAARSALPGVLERVLFELAVRRGLQTRDPGPPPGIEQVMLDAIRPEIEQRLETGRALDEDFVHEWIRLYDLH